jgi:cysteine desulfurase
MDQFSAPSAGRYYFDWAATAIPEPFYAGDAGFEAFANPSSPHLEGRKARDALENARIRCAAALGLPSKHVYFTSGGTESNALALYSLLLRKNSGGILSSPIEHASVRENCSVLERLGKQSASIGVEKTGLISPRTLEKALEKHPETRFAAIMTVNNEIGSIMDMPALTALIRRREGPPVHIHSDMVQAIGKIPVDIGAWDLDSASFSAHKLGGPRGIGLLYLRKNLEVLYTGGGQEGGMRPGTENTLGALAMADCLEKRAAPEIVRKEYEKAKLRWKQFIRGLKTLDRCFLIPQDRLEEDERFSPWILQAGFRDIPGEVMVRALDDAGFAVSAGSACSSYSPERPVLAAMGIDEQRGLEGIRISQGWSTTGEEIDLLLAAIKKILLFL